ncbi:carboxymuconolactone decarboxylase family protein [Cupriavidus necator]|uniref:carboxymuconolactone decarboxylase family protein n=1 Tax=Cupriavidus necator TaxID=106590 RepID=UPI0006911C3C|nr:carboxymuconolactone decarboxylase family protein [Cupriavidus necator]
MTRYPPIAPEDMYYEQKRVFQAVSSRRKPSASSQGGVEGPFVPLVHVPGILDRLQSLGEYCRFHTAIPPKLRELAIMITARHVAAQLEFHVHAMEAREFGLAEEAIEAIAARRRPAAMDDDEALVYDFCTALFAEGRVSDALFDRAAERFGKAAIIDLIATCGYYATLGLVINVAKPATPAFLEGFIPAFPVPND